MWNELMVAIEIKNKAEAERLAKAITTKDADKKDNNGNTALILAAAWGLQEVCQILIPKMSDAAINHVAKSGETALTLTITWSFKEISEQLICRMSDAAINHIAKSGETALTLATSYCLTEACKMLIPRMSDAVINHVAKNGHTALTLATSHVLVDVCKLLLPRMSETAINHIARDGYSALTLATSRNLKEIINLIKLFQQKAVNESMLLNQLIISINSNNQDEALKLAKKVESTTLNKKDSNNDTVLTIAARKGFKEVSKILIAKMSPESINQVTNNGNTALTYAIDYGCKEICEILLNVMSISSIKAINKEGKNAFDIAIEKGYKQLAEKIQQKQNEYEEQQYKQIGKQSGLEQSETELNTQVESNLIFSTSTSNTSGSAVGSNIKVFKSETYSKQKILNLLKSQYVQDSIKIQILNFKDTKLTTKEVEKLIIPVMEGVRTLVLPIHLKTNVWSGMVIKNDKGSLKVIYNDPRGVAFNKSDHLKAFIHEIRDLEDRTSIIDLKKKQTEYDNDTITITIENLIKLANTSHTDKKELTDLLTLTQQIEQIKLRHSLDEGTAIEYSEYKLAKLLELELKGKEVHIAPITTLINKEQTEKNLNYALKKLLDTKKSSIIPLHTEGDHFVALALKLKVEGNLQVIYIDPKGKSLFEAQNSGLILKTVSKFANIFQIIDLKLPQQTNDHDSGAYTVENFIKLITHSTDGLEESELIKLFKAPEGYANSLRIKHTELLRKAIVLGSESTTSISDSTIDYQEDEGFIEEELQNEEQTSNINTDLYENTNNILTAPPMPPIIIFGDIPPSYEDSIEKNNL